MSELIAKVTRVLDLQPHSNADKLEIVKICGWQIISGKGNYSVGDLVIHIQPETLIPISLAEKWGVAQYLTFTKADPAFGRVRAVNLRGLTSHGFLVENELNAEEGSNVAETLGLKKWDPPPVGQGQVERPNHLFHRYTDIQNLRNYPDKLNFNIPLVLTEKLHGSCSRVGWVFENGSLQKCIGTHYTQRKIDEAGFYELPFTRYEKELNSLLEWLQASNTEIKSLIIFGEIYGAGVQDLHYDAKFSKGYKVFDIALNGEYINWYSVEQLCEKFGLPTVPVVAYGMFTYDEILEYAKGQTLLGKHNIREGVVVRPWHEELQWGNGTLDPFPKRMIFKVINDDYLTRKGGTEFH